MIEEFNLSNKIQEVNDFELDNDVHPATKAEVIEVGDFKEFIKILKAEIKRHHNFTKKIMIRAIDKYAGEKLCQA